jgi:hypothetical protein
MLHLTKGLTENIYFTGGENTTIINGEYRIIFINRLTTESISTQFLQSISSTMRFEKISINVNNYFLNSSTGFWDYIIQDEDFKEVEKGFMYLHPSTNFTPTEYTAQQNLFVTYNGK